MKNFSIPIVFCSDEAYLSHSLVGMISILKSNPELRFEFHLISAESVTSKVDIIRKYIEKHKSIFSFHTVSMKEFKGLPTNLHFSKAVYLRLKIPSIIGADKILYLDSDVLCTGSLIELEKVELGNKALAAVGDPVGDFNYDLGMDPESIYLNSGVLLFNRNLWEECSLSEKILSYMSLNKEKLRFADQCGINGVINGRFSKLPLKFNLQGSFFRSDFEFENGIWTKDEVDTALNAPIFIHYTGPSKPWEYQNDHPLKSLYWKFQRDSPLRLRFPEGMKTMDHLKRMFPNSWKKKLKSIIVSNPN